MESIWSYRCIANFMLNYSRFSINIGIIMSLTYGEVRGLVMASSKPAASMFLFIIGSSTLSPVQANISGLRFLTIPPNSYSYYIWRRLCSSYIWLILRHVSYPSDIGIFKSRMIRSNISKLPSSQCSTICLMFYFWYLTALAASSNASNPFLV